MLESLLISRGSSQGEIILERRAKNISEITVHNTFGVRCHNTMISKRLVIQQMYLQWITFAGGKY